MLVIQGKRRLGKGCLTAHHVRTHGGAGSLHSHYQYGRCTACPMDKSRALALEWHLGVTGGYRAENRRSDGPGFGVK